MTTIARMAPMLIVMGAIFLLSHQPGDSFDLPSFPGADKLVHMIIYAVLAASIIAAFSPRLRAEKYWLVFWTALLVSALYGLSDEFHQAFIPNRDSSGFDLLADIIGAAAVCLFWLYHQLRGHHT